MTKLLKDQDRILHMFEAAQKAVGFTKEKNRSDLDHDEKLTFALIRLLEVLGEAAHNVSDDFCQRHPNIPWKRIAGTRNRLIHGYFDVDHDILWQIITTQLPPLISELDTILSSNFR